MLEAPSIRPVATAADLDAFIAFPWQVYRSDPCWVPPLRDEIRRRLDPARNPFYATADRELFLAWRGSAPVGRIAAIDNWAYNQQLDESTGFFGFFESVDDPTVSGALVATAAAWLTRRGLTAMRGPVDGAPTDEAGVLILGHDRRPALWEAHSPRYYQALLEHAGLRQFDDLAAYELDLATLGPDLAAVPPAVWRLCQRVHQRGVTVRTTRQDQWDTEVGTILQLYNTAFRTLPGHPDLSEAQFRHQAARLRPFLDPDLILLADLDNAAVGFALALPDLNEALWHLDGHLGPLELIRLWWHRRRIRTASVKLLGVLPEHRGRGIETLLGVDLMSRAMKRNYRRLEISLVSERNTDMRRLVDRVGARLYRVHRVYERDL